LYPISRISEILAAEISGLDAQFQMPKPGDARLLAAGRSFAELAAPHREAFIRRTLPGNFLDDLNAHIAAFDRAAQRYIDASRTCTEIAHSINATMDRAANVASLLDALVRFTFTRDPVKIGDWDRACDLHRKPLKRAPVVTPDLAHTTSEPESAEPEFEAVPAASREKGAVFITAPFFALQIPQEPGKVLTMLFR
jgi:hypothetical protein